MDLVFLFVPSLFSPPTALFSSLAHPIPVQSTNPNYISLLHQLRPDQELSDLPPCTFKKLFSGASLVAQWLRICLPMQGTRVRALVWEDPTCRGAAGPVSHNY